MSTIRRLTGGSSKPHDPSAHFVEMARRGVTREHRPEREELDNWFKEAEAA